MPSRVPRRRSASATHAASLRSESLLSIEIDATPRHEVQLVAQSAQSFALLIASARRCPVTQGDDGVAVNAGHRGVAVHERR